MTGFRTPTATLTALIAAATLLIGGCRQAERVGADGDGGEAPAPYQAEIDEGLGAAVAILVDTSGSMKETAPGDTRPKSELARAALEQMLDATDAFTARRPDFPVKIGLYAFASDVEELSPIQPYDRTAVRAALDRLPPPGGGTAIGDALRQARPALYRAGVFRKYLLVVTDGENTRGRSPEAVARDIYTRSEGAVEIHFVAFDTAAEQFSYLQEVGGSVVGAGTGAELRTALDGIYQGRILAEAIDAGERDPVRK